MFIVNMTYLRAYFTGYQNYIIINYYKTYVH